MRLALPPDSCKIYTPITLAAALVRALNDDPQASWLEPCHGKGVFIEVIASFGIPREQIVAVDLDRMSVAADSLATTFRGVDFLRWAGKTERRFDRIVGNPPFVPIKWLPPSLQQAASSVLDLNGCPIGRGANTWYAFVLTSIRLLKPGGSLAFVLPSAAEFADYSAGIRREIRDAFGTLDLYRCERPLFQEVQEGTLVAVAREYGSHPCMVRRRSFQTPEQLIHSLSNRGRSNGHRCPPGANSVVSAMTSLDAIARIRLGGVTGDASFFLMTEEERQFLELPMTAVKPVVSRARHLRSALLEPAAWNELKKSGERIWLFKPSKLVAKHPKVKWYLDLDASEGGCDRSAYKVSIRDPWYFTKTPDAPDAFLSGMSQHGPWLCINGMPGLNATNTLYVVTFKDRNPESWYMWALALLSTAAQRQVRRIGRRYADGLIKYEPGPLSKIKLPKLRFDENHKALYLLAVDALLSGDRKTAKDIADSARA